MKSQLRISLQEPLQFDDPLEFIREFRKKLSPLMDFLKKDCGDYHIENKKEEINKLQFFLNERISQFISSIPNPSREEGGFWNQIDGSKIPSLMEEILGLMSDCKLCSDIGVHMTTSSSFKADFFPESTIILYKLFAINTQLAYRLPETKLDAHTSINYYDLHYQVNSPHFKVLNPKMHLQLEAVLKFFNPNFNLIFFQQSAPKSDALFSFKSTRKEEFRLDEQEIHLSDYNNKSGNSTGIYFEQFFEEIQGKKELLEKFYERYPALIQESKRNHLATLFREPLEKETFLPKSVHYLMRSAVLCTAHIHNLLNARDYLLNGSCFKFSTQRPEDEHKKLILKPTSLSARNCVSDLKDDYNPIQNQFGDLLDKVDSDKCQKSTQNKEMTEKSHPNQPLEISRKIGMLGINPYEETARVADLIKNEFQLLKEKEIQGRLLVHLFTPLRISSQLQANPEIVHQLFIAIDEAIQHYNHLNDLETCLFLAKLGNDLKAFVEEEKFYPALKDYREFITKVLLLRCQGSPSTQFKCYQILALFYQQANLDKITQDKSRIENAARDLIGYSILQSLTGPTEKNRVQNTISAIKFQLMPNIEQYLKENKEACDSILKELVKLVNPTANDDNWNWTEDAFISKDHIIDIHQGTIKSSDQKEYSLIPNRISNDIIFRRFFKIQFKIQTAKIINRNSLYVFNEGLESELIVKIDENSIKYQKKIGEEIYRYIKTPANLRNNAPGFVDDFSICWIREGKNPDIIVYNLFDQVPLRIELEETPGEYYIKKITKNNTLSWIPFHLAPPFLHGLNLIEKECNCIECWEDETHQLKEVKLRNYELDFETRKIKNHTYLFCKQYPGFYLCENHNDAMLQKIDHLTLRNLKGKEKILLPEGKLTSGYAEKGFDLKIDQTNDAGYWLEYERVDGNLHSKEVKAQLHLAYLLAAQNKYENALKILKDLNPLRRFTEVDCLKAFAASLNNKKSNSAMILFLHLQLIVYENNLKYPLPSDANTPSPFDIEHLIDAYSCYQNNFFNFPSLTLNEKQEKILIDLIFALNEENIINAKIRNDQNLIAKFELQKSNLEAWLENRKNYLHTHKVKLGLNFTDVKHVRLNGKGLISADSFLNELMLHRKYIVDLFTLPKRTIQNPSFFKSNFFNLYRIAQNGTKQEKEHLKKFMALNAGAFSPWYFLLSKVVCKPSAYPKIELLEALVFEHCNNKDLNAYKLLLKEVDKILKTDLLIEFRWIIFNLGTCVKSLFQSEKSFPSLKKQTDSTPLRLDGVHLQHIDEAFNTYFNSLRTHFFNENQLEVSLPLSTLPTEHPDTHIEKKLKKENEELQSFIEQQPKTRTVYYFKNEKGIKELSTELRKEAENLQRSLKAQKAALLWQLNHVPRNAEKRSLKQLHKFGFRKQLSWEDLQKLTLKGDLESFTAKTDLGEAEAKALLAGISDYLTRSTRLDQMHTILKNLHNAKEAKNPARKNLLIHETAELLNMQRAYTPSSDQLDKLWFEYANHYLYRSSQLDKLGEINQQNTKEILAEMPTGFGKTKTMITTANKQKAAEGKLVVNTWPASLEMTNASDIKEQMKKGYGTKIDRFTFDRSTPFTSGTLKYLYSELKKDLRLGRPLSAKSESLRAIQLHAILFLDRADHLNEKEMEKQIEYFLKIHRLIKVSGWNSIDEPHIVLDPLDKLIYTLGNPSTVSKREIAILEEIFDLLTAAEFKDLGIRENQQIYIEEKLLQRTYLLLAEHFERKFNIDKNQKESYTNFVLGKVDGIPGWLNAHPDKDQIALVKGMLTQVLQAAFKGSVDENYGLSKLHINKKEYAVSYARANTPKETKENPSQFKNPHETFSKTYITYLHKGLSKRQFIKFVTFLQKDALKESKDNIPLDKTQSNAFFQEIFSGCEKSLSRLSETDIEKIYDSTDLKFNKQVLFFYIRTIVAPQLKLYTSSLISTVHNYRSQFSSSLSISATPQDKASHGPDTHFIPMKGTSAGVTHLLLTKCSNPKTLHKIQQAAPSEALENTVEDIIKKNPKMRAVIDVGAQYKGLSNLEIAAKMRKQYQNTTDASAIIFFDESEGLFKIMDIETGGIYHTDEHKVERGTSQTIYDQSRCFGSDLAQEIDAVGLMLTGKKTTKSEASQGGGRMRMWHKGQSVEVAYPEILEKEIFGENTPEISKLLVYWISNQTKEEAEKNYQSQLQQMDNELRSFLFDKILGIDYDEQLNPKLKKLDVPSAIQSFKKFKSEFIKPESLNPWKMYANIPIDKQAKSCLEDHHQKCLKTIEGLSGLSKKEKQFLENRLNAYPKKWEEMNLPKLAKTNQAGLGMECEVLQEIEVENQLEAQAQREEADYSERIPFLWPNDVDLFNPGWEKPEKINLIDKVSAIFKKAVNSFTMKKAGTAGLALMCVGSVIMIGVGCGSAFISAVALPIITAVGITIYLTLMGAGILTIGLGGAAWLIRKISQKTKSKRTNTIHKVGEYLSFHLPEEMKSHSRIFSPNFLVSNNFYVHKTQGLLEEPQKPFDEEQKPLYSVLIIMDALKNGKKDFKIMAIDQNDSLFFQQKLKKDQKAENADSRKRKIGIFDLQLNQFLIQGANAFDEEDIKEAEFHNLIGQAKFLNGDIDYTEEELRHFGSHLEQAAKSGGGGHSMQTFYLDYVLRMHPAKKRRLEFSKAKRKPIAELLEIQN